CRSAAPPPPARACRAPPGRGPGSSSSSSAGGSGASPSGWSRSPPSPAGSSPRSSGRRDASSRAPPSGRRAFPRRASVGASLAWRRTELLAVGRVLGGRGLALGLAPDGVDPALGSDGREQEVEETLLGLLTRADAALLLLLLAYQVHRQLGQVADDRLDVAADV